MIVSRRSQKDLPFGGLSGDGLHIADPELARIDEILQDEEFLDILRRAFARQHPKAVARGRSRLALNRTLRCLVLKHIRNWSFPDLHRELQRNLDYRAFTQFFAEPIPAFSTFCRNFAWVDGETLEDLNAHLCACALVSDIIEGRRLRLDTTVCETNIHHPTESTVLRDGIRVLQREVQRAEKLLPVLGPIRDRSRAALHRVLEIHRAARGKGEAAKQQFQHSYRSLLRMSRAVVSHAQSVAAKLGDGRVTRALSAVEQAMAEASKEQLETMAPRVDRVIRQTRARVCRGNTQYPNKILSLFEPETSPIRKGKAHKPTEFGRLIEIEEVEQGFVSDYRVHDGNPADVTLLLPALERHRQRFGRPPREVAGDRGFFSAANEKGASALGVKRISIPARGPLSAVRARLQRCRWFRGLQRWRAGGEGRIGTLKNRYGLDRCMYKGDGGMKRWVGACIFANNLVVVARRSRSTAAISDEQAAA